MVKHHRGFHGNSFFIVHMLTTLPFPKVDMTWTECQRIFKSMKLVLCKAPELMALEQQSRTERTPAVCRIQGQTTAHSLFLYPTYHAYFIIANAGSGLQLRNTAQDGFNPEDSQANISNFYLLLSKFKMRGRSSTRKPKWETATMTFCIQWPTNKPEITPLQLSSTFQTLVVVSSYQNWAS